MGSSFIDLEQIENDKKLFERREKMAKVSKASGMFIKGMAVFTGKFFQQILKLVKGGTKSSAPKLKSGGTKFITWFIKFSHELQKMDKKANNHEEDKPKPQLKKKDKVVYTNNYNLNST